jgi:parallel beta-helix repeat protein
MVISCDEGSNMQLVRNTSAKLKSASRSVGPRRRRSIVYVSAFVALAALGFSAGSDEISRQLMQPGEQVDTSRMLVGPEPDPSAARKVTEATTEPEIATASPAVALAHIADDPDQIPEPQDVASSGVVAGAATLADEKAPPAAMDAVSTTITTAAPRTTTTNTTAAPAAPQTTTPTPTPKAIVPTPPSVDEGTIYVASDGEDHPNGGAAASPMRTLQFAVDQASAGDTIVVRAGTYESVRIKNRSDLTLRGEGGATLTTNSYSSGAGVQIEGSTGITVESFRIQTSLWGVAVLSSSDITVRGNRVSDIGQEAISVKHGSNSVVIANNVVDTTGQRPGGIGGAEYREFGEGIYLGTGGLLDTGGADIVSNVLIVGNEIMNTTSEAIDIKASVINVTIRGNRIHHINVHSGGAIALGRGTREYRGNMIVEGNTIWAISTRSTWADGIGIRVSTDSVIRNNIIFDVEDYGILVDEELRSTGGDVTVENNFVLGSGHEAFLSRSLNVPVHIIGNVEGPSAQSLLDQVGGGSPAQHISALVAALDG